MCINIEKQKSEYTIHKPTPTPPRRGIKEFTFLFFKILP